MLKSITSIWIESENNGPIIGGREFMDDNSDVIVTFKDGSKFVATFFTFENIKTLVEKNNKTGEMLNGKYFWASDMILIDKVERSNIELVIEELIQDGSFHQIFRKV